MTQYSWQVIKQKFENAAYSRKNEKKRGNSKYVNDAGYWEGGRCNYGGAHNLQEDCEKLASFFAEITELKNLQKELISFNNQKEFEKNKQKLTAKIDSYISGLNMKTSSTTSIAGVCCIWGDFKDHFDSQISNFRKDLELLKSNIERVKYDEAKELLKIQSEKRKLQKEIEENERKARNEPNENKRNQFIFLANQAKDKWRKLLERKSQLKTAKLGDDFNPDAHINKFFAELESKLNQRNKPASQPSTTRFPWQNNPNNGSNTNYEPINLPSAEFIPNNNDNQEPQSFLEKHWKEFLIIGVYLLGTYYIVFKSENHG